MKKLLHFFGMSCIPEIDRDNWGECPVQNVETISDKEQMPDGTTVDIDGRFRTKEENEHGTIWNTWDGQTRPSHLTNSDKDIILEKKLNESKYKIIKQCWATKMRVGAEYHYPSSAKASIILSNQHGRGYKIRTIEKYYAAINEANPSPEAVVAGTHRKTPQMA